MVCVSDWYCRRAAAAERGARVKVMAMRQQKIAAARTSLGFMRGTTPDWKFLRMAESAEYGLKESLRRKEGGVKEEVTCRRREAKQKEGASRKHPRQRDQSAGNDFSGASRRDRTCYHDRHGRDRGDSRRRSRRGSHGQPKRRGCRSPTCARR